MLDAYEQKATASDADTLNWFGSSVAVDGDYAIVGAYGNDDYGTWSGSAYIFRCSGGVWTEQAVLYADDLDAGDELGRSVAISGGYAIAGAHYKDGGAAYIYYKDQGGTDAWGQQAKLVADDGETSDCFGESVAISGNHAVVGAHCDEHSGISNAGSAYIFYRSGTTWSQQAKLTASDAAEADQFGRSVAISGDWAIAGANADDDGGEGSGSAYIFLRSGSTWSQHVKLTASDAAADDRFGWSVSVSGAYAIVGAYGNDCNGSSSGAAYVFYKDQGGTGAWGQQTKLTGNDSTAGDVFGTSVSIHGDFAIVGASSDYSSGGYSTGSAFVFLRSGTTWTQQVKLALSDGFCDPALYRPSTGEWLLVVSGDSKSPSKAGVKVVKLGGDANDIPVPADYNVDGATDAALYNLETRKWSINGSADIKYGRAGELPMPADFNGDGAADLAMVDLARGTWRVKGKYKLTIRCEPTSFPLLLDYDADGRPDPGFYCFEDGSWHIFTFGREPGHNWILETNFGFGDETVLPIAQR